MENLPHRKAAVYHGVMKPEYRIKSRIVDVRHVATTSSQAMDLIVDGLDWIIVFWIIGWVEPSFVAEVDVLIVVGKEVEKPAAKGGGVVVELLRYKIILRLRCAVLSCWVSQCLLILVKLDSKVRMDMEMEMIDKYEPENPEGRWDSGDWIGS
jgi:hypothetical protein